jgi:glycine/D-amino acid oxidase-like deaminating enzyme
MQTDFLIVGQGIAGSLLYYSLTKRGASCILVDEEKTNSASRVAAGLINPVTGRRLVKSWMIDELIPVFKKVYGEFEKELGVQCLHETKLTWHLPATDIVEAFGKRMGSQTDFLQEASSEEERIHFNFPYNAGNISPCYVVNVQLLLDSIKKNADSSGNLLSDKFDHHQLRIIGKSIQYKNIAASKIIFCEGSSATNNPWFANLPYSLNKGEALTVSIEGLPRTSIYKFKQTLVPLPGEKNLWWYGSNYIWEFKDDQPTRLYRERSELELKNWLKLPFAIIAHKAAIRYATVERRPFVGLHPSTPCIAIFNGWGTKGCSLVPHFSEQFAEHLINPESPLQEEVDVSRFARLLKGSTF